MSRQTVRRGIAVYLGGAYDSTLRVCTGNTTFGVNLVRPGWPKRVDDRDFGLGQGVLSGAYVNVHVRGQREQRVAFGGPNDGLKKVTYDIALHIFHRSHEAHGEDAEDHLEQVVNGLITRLRADRSAGGSVFQQGEGQSAGMGVDDLITSYGEPAVKGDRSETYAGIGVTALEFLHT